MNTPTCTRQEVHTHSDIKAASLHVAVPRIYDLRGFVFAPWIFSNIYTYLVGETPNDAYKNEVFLCVTCAAADREG